MISLMATNIKMKVFVLLFLVANVECLHLQFFKWTDYRVFIREFKLSSNEEKTCFTLKDSITDPDGINPTHELVWSIKTDKCVILYQSADCEHRTSTWRVDKDTPDYPKDANDTSTGQLFKIGSFHVCSQELGGGPSLDVDFYPQPLTNGKIMLQYRNVCGCQNIPYNLASDESRIRSLDNYGNGLAVFEEEHCKPPYVYITPGQRTILGPNGLFHTTDVNLRVRSFYPMGTVDCAKLDANVIKFDIKKDSTQDSFLELENVTNTLESVFVNDGPAEITQQYTATQRVKEVLEFTKATGFSKVETVGAEVSVENTLKFGLPLVAEDNAKLKITGKYQWQGTTSGTDTDKKSVENEETYSIQQSIKIPPCTEYRVNSFVKMVKNYTIEYTAFARLTGKVGEDKMEKNDLKLHIGPGMEYIRDIDDHTIEVSVEGQMFAKYGVKTLIVGKGHRIEGCMNYTTVSNVKPVSDFVIELPFPKE